MSPVLKPTVKHLCGQSFFQTKIKDLLEENFNIKNRFTDFKPCLAWIKASSDSNHEFDYLLSAENVGAVFVKHIIVPEAEILAAIQRCNEDPTIHGIFVSEAIFKEQFKSEIAEAIIPDKDVAGVTYKNFSNDGFVVAIGLACLQLLETTDKIISNSKVVVIGESDTAVNIARLFLLKNSIVTVCHPNKGNLGIETQNADIIVIWSGESQILSKIRMKKDAIILGCSGSIENPPSLGESVGAGEVTNTAAYIAYLPDLVVASSALILSNTFTSAKKIFIPPCNVKWNFTPNPLKTQIPVLSDIEIARSQKPKNISILAKEIGLLLHEFEPYGRYKAKVSLDVLNRLKSRKPGKYVVVTGITPTPFGEGKSTTTIGLCQALGAHKNVNVIACVRQPSQGPTFGIKGGAAGGGYSQIIPMEDFNLHLTGDIHAVTAANNLLAAQIDARMFHEATQTDEALYKRLVPEKAGNRTFSKIQLAHLNKLGITETDPLKLTEEEIKSFVRLDIDPDTITWQRVLDTNDRFLRRIMIGLSTTEKNMTREAQFDISVASEIMAILALSTGFSDLRDRLSKIVVARDRKGTPVTADDLGVTGALATLLKDAVKPNLMQTLEGTPVFVHAGPFANIAHGNSSVIADQMALKLVGNDGFVVTEAGFGADIGLEKFFNIKCRYSGLIPDAVVIVATVRALKMHGGGPEVTAGVPLPQAYKEEQVELVKKGFCNLAKHIENVKKFGIPVIVAINRFSTDTVTELECIKQLSMLHNAEACIVSDHFCQGGEGAKELAEGLIKTVQLPSNFRFLYELKDSIEDKIKRIAQEIYGAKGIKLQPQAEKMIAVFEKEGLNELPICMAKTQLSFSHDPKLKGVPTDFEIPIRDVKASVGAGFLCPLVGSLLLMPGLPTRPCFYDIQINEETEEIEGLF